MTDRSKPDRAPHHFAQIVRVDFTKRVVTSVEGNKPPARPRPNHSDVWPT